MKTESRQGNLTDPSYRANSLLDNIKQRMPHFHFPKDHIHSKGADRNLEFLEFLRKHLQEDSSSLQQGKLGLSADFPPLDTQR